MREYVDLNECDHVRANAVQGWLNNDFGAAQVVDYFLYSVCELCCDCVPMGVSPGDYAPLSTSHSDDNPTLWDAERGNCPAHAQYDLCNVLPHVTYLTTPNGAAQSRPKACPSLNAWLNSDRSTNWQSDPDTSLDGDTSVFLNGALSTIGCDQASVWNQCYDMESRQNHLAIPGGSIPDPAPQTFAENEEVLEEKTASSPGDQETNDAQSVDSNASSSDEEGEAKENVEENDGITNDDSGKQEGESSEEEEDVDPEASPESADSCFPATATVELEDGSHKQMQDLLIGDRVRISATQFSEVFMFSHRERDVSDAFYVRIRSAESSVTMTAGHYLRVQRSTKENSDKFMMAGEVKVGDRIQTSRSQWTSVLEVSRVSSQGLYNPHTREGTIAVDGILASTYTRSVGSSTGHALLAPMRALDFVGLATEKYLGTFLAQGVDERLASLARLFNV